MKSNFNFIFIILCILLQSTGSVFGKYAALTLEGSNFLSILTNIFYLLSITCLIFQAIFWQQALIHYRLSVAYPFISLVNFVVLILSYFLFKESISINNIFGLILISSGITILASKSGDPI
jgi:multidrug transporter EmrE-like cation transporter